MFEKLEEGSLDEAKRKAKKIVKSPAKRQQVYRVLHDYTKTGEPLFESAAKLARNKKNNGDKTAHIYEFVQRAITEKNTSALDALAEIMPRDEILLISSQSSSTVFEGFLQAEKWASYKSQFRSGIAGAVAYPLFSGVLSLVALYINLREQVPLLTGMVGEGHESIAWLASLHNILVNNVFSVMTCFSLFVVWIVFYSLRQPPGGARKYLDRLPPWSVQKNFSAGAFLNSLATMLSNKIAFPDAIARINASADVYLAGWMKECSARLDSNASLAETLDIELIDRDTRFIIKDFEGKPSFFAMMRDQAESNLKRLLVKVKSMAVLASLAIMLGSLGLNAATAMVAMDVQSAVAEKYK